MKIDNLDNVVTWLIITVLYLGFIGFLYTKKDILIYQINNENIDLKGTFSQRNNLGNSTIYQETEPSVDSIIANYLSFKLSSDSLNQNLWMILDSSYYQKHLKILYKNKKNVLSQKIPIELILFILGIAGGIIFNNLFKHLFVSRFGHIKKGHKWLMKYGISKIHEDYGPELDSYFKILKLLTKGVEAEYLKEGEVKIFLFYRGLSSDIINFYNEGNGDNKVLFDFWKKTADNEFVKRNWDNREFKVYYKINRFFVGIPDKINANIEVDNNRQDYFEITGGKINSYIIDEKTISETLKELKNDVDFAWIDFNSTNIVIGFNKGKITYVISNDTSKRIYLHDRALSIMSYQSPISRT